jgi:hypothetical protein
MKRKNSFLKVLGFVTILVAVGAAGFMVGKMGFSSSPHSLPKSAVIALAILFIPAFLLVIGFHEGGHALMGIWMKFDFRMYVIGPFMWEKEQASWQFKWNRNVNTAGGMVICMPLDGENLKKRFSSYAAGGPIASLVLAGLAYGVYLLFSPNISGSEQIIFRVASHFFLLIAVLSLAIGIVTSIPMHQGGFYTDGARILRLQRGGDTARFDVLILKIIANASGGTRPRLLMMDDLLEAQVLAKKLNAPFGVYLHSFFHQVAFDLGEIERAEKHLLDYIGEADLIPDGIRNAVWLDAAFFYAFAKKDIDTAARYWQQFKPTAIIPKAQIFATEAAMSFLRNDPEVARSKVDAAMAALPDMIDKGIALALKDRLIYLRDLLSRVDHRTLN